METLGRFQHQQGNGEGVVPIFIDRGAPHGSLLLGSSPSIRFCRHGCATLDRITKQLLGWLASRHLTI